ncbi:unnamed protein product [Albugo candida]|uniref:Uncharacterized protein n=1 Tax=Albugo candida TaxID=65357 RepID=A0A024GE69_9STRA|nr:unnamed protein product [Albugo candida]|eukprot:CCI44636.1 unnamed protein product [Albugo candida]
MKMNDSELLDHVFRTQILREENEWSKSDVVIRSTLLLMYKEVRNHRKQLQQLKKCDCRSKGAFSSRAEILQKQIECRVREADKQPCHIEVAILSFNKKLKETTFQLREECNKRFDLLQHQMRIQSLELAKTLEIYFKRAKNSRKRVDPKTENTSITTHRIDSNEAEFPSSDKETTDKDKCELHSSLRRRFHEQLRRQQRQLQDLRHPSHSKDPT